MSDFRLKAFYSVAKNLSFTRAAKELFVSQPAITKHINELERQYSVRLFDRTGGKIMLTDAGRLMLEHCSRILDEYNRMEYDMNLLNERSSGHISIGASTTVAQYVLPQILAEFTERFPQIEVSLTNGNSRDIENALLNHDIDLGMVEGITHSAGLQYEPFLEDELRGHNKAVGQRVDARRNYSTGAVPPTARHTRTRLRNTRGDRDRTGKARNKAPGT